MLQGLLGLIQTVSRILLQLHKVGPQNQQVPIPRPRFAHLFDRGEGVVVALLFPETSDGGQLLLERPEVTHDRRPLPFCRSRSACSISFFICRAFRSGGWAAARFLISRYVFCP